MLLEDDPPFLLGPSLFSGASCQFPGGFSKWLITMVIVSPLTGTVPLPNGLFMAYKSG